MEWLNPVSMVQSKYSRASKRSASTHTTIVALVRRLKMSQQTMLYAAFWILMVGD